MSNNLDQLDMFAAETCGATIAQNLLRILALKEVDTSERLLDQCLQFPLIRFGFESGNQSYLVADLHQSFKGTDSTLEYRHAKLAYRALTKLNVEPDALLLELVMRRAYSAHDQSLAESLASRLLLNAATIPASVVVRSHDILARIDSDLGRFKVAATNFQAGAETARAAGLEYDEWDQRTNLVLCLYAQKRYLDALREIDIAEQLARQLNKPHALMKTLIDRGNSEFALGRFQEARTAYLEVVTVAEENNDIARQSDALGNLGNIAFGNGNYLEAEEFHTRALALSRQMNNPGSAQYDLNNLAQTYWQLGRSNEALEALKEALQIAQQQGDSESVARYQSFLAQINSALGRPRTAETLVRAEASNSVSPLPQAQQPDETRQDAAVEVERRVRQLLDNKDHAGALKLIEQQLAADPQNCKLICLHGTLLVIAGDIEGARAAYELALSYEPANSDAHSRVVDLHMKTNRLDELLVQYERLVGDDPFNAGVRVGLALIYSRLGRHDDSIQSGLEAVRLAPGEELSYMALAEGQRERAFFLLDSNWDAAWMDFQDFTSTSSKLISLSSDQKGQWYSLTAIVFERFAMGSFHANPPVLFSMESREIEVLALAAGYAMKAKEYDSRRNPEAITQRITNAICSMARPEQITTAAGHLRVDGHFVEALTLLVLSLQLDENQAEAKFQLAHLMNNGTEGGRQAALDYIREAIALEPNTPKYREAKLSFQRLVFPLTKNPEESGDESG